MVSCEKKRMEAGQVVGRRSDVKNPKILVPLTLSFKRSDVDNDHDASKAGHKKRGSEVKQNTNQPYTTPEDLVLAVAGPPYKLIVNCKRPVYWNQPEIKRKCGPLVGTGMATLLPPHQTRACPPRLTRTVFANPFQTNPMTTRVSSNYGHLQHVPDL